MDKQYWSLKSTVLFERLSEEQAEQLERVSRYRRFEKGSLVYLPSDSGESLLLVTSGRVKIYQLTGEGKQQVLSLVEPGDFFGEMSVFDDGRREEFAEAMLSSSVLCIPAEDVRRLMADLPDVSLGVTKLMGLRRRRVERRLKSLLFRSNRERLISLLLELAETYGRQTSAGVELGIKLSHQELANVIGSTRESVTVLLGELAYERLIRIEKRKISLVELDRLARIVEQPAPAIPEPTVPRAVPQPKVG